MDFKIAMQAGITLSRIDGRAVLFSKRNGSFFGMNDSAHEMLASLQADSFTSVVESLSARFQVPESTIAEDLTELVSELEARNLVCRVVVPENNPLKEVNDEAR